MDNEELKIGSVLVNLRKQKGQSQEDLAFDGKMSRKTIFNLEADIHVPTITTLGRYAKGLGMTPSDLLLEIEKNTNFLTFIDQITSNDPE